MIRVVIADDHAIVRQGIRSLLERARDITVVGEAEDGASAVKIIEQLLPDVAVVDISMPQMNGLQAVERLRAMGVPSKIVVLSMYSDEAMVREALKLGAKGYIIKRAEMEELLLAIRAVHRGETYISSAIAEMLVSDFVQSREVTPIERLSAREREVLKLIAQGHTTNEIARIIVISPKTVEKYRASLMEKLDIHDMAGLIRFAIKQGVISLDE